MLKTCPLQQQKEAFGANIKRCTNVRVRNAEKYLSEIETLKRLKIMRQRASCFKINPLTFCFISISHKKHCRARFTNRVDLPTELYRVFRPQSSIVFLASAKKLTPSCDHVLLTENRSSRNFHVIAKLSLKCFETFKLIRKQIIKKCSSNCVCV